MVRAEGRSIGEQRPDSEGFRYDDRSSEASALHACRPVQPYLPNMVLGPLFAKPHFSVFQNSLREHLLLKNARVRNAFCIRNRLRALKTYRGY
jgi:hypothetical protein